MNLSLIDCISSLDKNNVSEIKEEITNLFKAGYKFFAKPLSHFSLNIPLGIPPAPALIIKPTEILKVFEEANLEDNSLSFYSKLESFKKAFIEMEKSILGQNTDKKIIVFIDDLDRCEAEHVINILSSIKNFFKYGKRTIFFCALDKNAVTKAIQTKYKDVIKSEEYLEKIFDVSFNMPSVFSINKLLT